MRGAIKIKRVNNDGIPTAVYRMETFANSGSTCSGGRKGHLYIVKSYNTPIFAFDDNDKMWYENGEKYSVTTSRHQNAVRAAIAKMERVVLCESDFLDKIGEVRQCAN